MSCPFVLASLQETREVKHTISAKRDMVFVQDYHHLIGSLTLLCMANCVLGASLNTFNVMSYGAVGDGIVDDSQALLKAWRAACESEAKSTTPVVLIPPKRTFLLSPLTFNGPCKLSPIYMLVSGRIVAPVKTGWRGNQKNAWMIFSNVRGLVVKGKGVIDGQGPSWWPLKPCFHDPANGIICKGPTGMIFRRCDGLRLDGFSKVNGPGSHILIMATNGAIVTNLRIIAPGDSPNTDAIDISSSTRVQIRNCFIATGDDCIAIGAGSSNIDVSGITCGPGHGIRVLENERTVVQERVGGGFSRRVMSPVSGLFG
ncbi:hypothetical protein CASFOL_024744 [Castilleja foliolosa]|uniref:Polygalacturonase n=1 Tax=Castilleja foliolosa TaxID=1961234 RepID=A0ABD3CP79_9LAMI